jgi:hypothetical protein
LAAIVSAGFACSCSCGTGNVKPPDKRTPAEVFEKDVAPSIMTTHGRIMSDSVEEKDGRIQYMTEDGRKWRVAYAKRDDGTYHYGTPEAVNPD